MIAKITDIYHGHTGDMRIAVPDYTGMADTFIKAAQELKLPEVPEKKLSFLKTLLQDYIVLTR